MTRRDSRRLRRRRAAVIPVWICRRHSTNACEGALIIAASTEADALDVFMSEEKDNVPADTELIKGVTASGRYGVIYEDCAR